MSDLIAQHVGTGEIAVSRIASPRLMRAVLHLRPRVAPAVGGRTVWPSGDASAAVTEWPNWVGRLEDRPARPTVVCVTEPGSRPPWSDRAVMIGRENGDYRVVGAEVDDGPRVAFGRRTRTVRRAVSYLVQGRGVAAAWPPESPIAVLLLAVTPAGPIAEHPPPRGMAVEAIGGLPEFPGGIRLEATDDVPDDALRSWAASLGAAIAAARES